MSAVRIRVVIGVRSETIDAEWKCISTLHTRYIYKPGSLSN